MQNLLKETESDVWPQIAPLLDAAMAALSEADHDAVVLRFFDGKSMKEIGAVLGTSENATKMRVSRAVGKLRLFFTRRDIVCAATALTAVISENSVQAAPAALAKTATAVAIANGTTASISTLTLIKGALKTMAWTKAKTPIMVSAVLLMVVGASIEVRKARADEKEDDSWRSAGLTWQQVGQTAPQVKILPTNGFYRRGTAGKIRFHFDVAAIHRESFATRAEENPRPDRTMGKSGDQRASAQSAQSRCSGVGAHCLETI